MKPIVFAIVVLSVAGFAVAQPPTTPVTQRGEAAFKNNGCYGCHIIGKFGTPIGPNLSEVGRKYAPEYLARWLRDPELQRPSAHMPKLELTEADVQALAAYLASLR
jgi:cytochrome c oxidase subunit II